MAKTNLYPERIYLSPNYAIERLYRLYEKYGIKTVFYDSKFQPEREAWITAVFALGYSRITSFDYWLRINPHDDTPDTFMVRFVPDEKGNRLDLFSIEIFEWERNSPYGLIEAIEKKLENKAYPAYFTLLCYAHNRQGEKLELEKIYQYFQVKPPKIGTLWVLTETDSKEMPSVLTQLFPGRSQDSFSIENEMVQHSNRVELVDVSRGMSKATIPRGEFTIPLP